MRNEAGENFFEKKFSPEPPFKKPWGIYRLKFKYSSSAGRTSNPVGEGLAPPENVYPLHNLIRLPCGQPPPPVGRACRSLFAQPPFRLTSAQPAGEHCSPLREKPKFRILHSAFCIPFRPCERNLNSAFRILHSAFLCIFSSYIQKMCIKNEKIKFL